MGEGHPQRERNAPLSLAHIPWESLDDGKPESCHDRFLFFVGVFREFEVRFRACQVTNCPPLTWIV
jgi:hypothetical protein